MVCDGNGGGSRPAAVTRFEPGEVIARRYRRGRWCTWAQAVRVVRDDEEGCCSGSRPAPTSPRSPTPTPTAAACRGLSGPDARSAWWFFEEGAFIEAGEFPFDGTHTGFRPDPTSPLPRLSDRLE
jgi:hypothetical protein